MLTPASFADRLLRVATHPAPLILGCVASFVLWMPFGLGYYDFPWEQSWAVLLLLAFVISFAVFSAVAVDRSRDTPLLSVLSLLMGLHGLFHMLEWWLRISVDLTK
jgi:hypothetical protein